MSFGLPGTGSISSGSWLPFGGPRRRNDDTSSPSATPLAASRTIAESPLPLVVDNASFDASFAASYHPETSPLFNPSVIPHSDATAGTPLFGKSPNHTHSWEAQPGAAESQNGQSSPLRSRVAALSPDLSTNMDDPIVQAVDDQGAVEQDTDEQDADAQDAVNQDANVQGAADQTTVDRHAETPQEAIEVGERPVEPEKKLLSEQDLDMPDTANSVEMNAESSQEHDEVAEEVSRDTEESPPHIGAAQTDEAEEKVIKMIKSPTPDRYEAASLEEEIPSSKRSRRTAAEMLSAASESITKNLGGRRKRFSTIPYSPAANPTPTSVKRSRRSMPVQGSTQTPRKRGRPKKSDIATTPLTVPQSVSKRGRPRKSDVLPSAPGSITKRRAGPTPRRTTDITSTSKPIQPSSPTATPKVGRPRKSLGTPSAAATETPKRRGRPPKNTPQPSSAKLSVSISSGAERTLNGTSRRSGRARAVPSPVKRGRPARNAVTSAPKATSTRGRRAVAKSTNNKSTTAEATVNPPKRRGRPPKTAAGVIKIETSPAPKKRGRGAAATKETPVASTRGGRSAKSVPVEAPKTSTNKKRGRPARAEAENKPEPPAKRQRTARQTGENSAPTRKSGRGVAKETSDNDVPSNAEVDAPQTRRSRRGAVELSSDKPTEKPAPKSRGRATKSGKGEIPTSKTATKKEATHPKRGKVAAPNRVEKKTSAAAVAPRRSTRSRN